MNNHQNTPKRKLLYGLFNLFLDAKSNEQDKDFFDEWELDRDIIINKNLSLVKKLQTIGKAKIFNEKIIRVKVFTKKLTEGIQSNSSEIKNKFESIIQNPRYAELQPMFRNLKNITENDKKTILNDARLLELMIELLAQPQVN